MLPIQTRIATGLMLIAVAGCTSHKPPQPSGEWVPVNGRAVHQDSSRGNLAKVVAISEHADNQENRHVAPH
jgi:hypothetical protein